VTNIVVVCGKLFDGLSHTMLGPTDAVGRHSGTGLVPDVYVGNHDHAVTDEALGLVEHPFGTTTFWNSLIAKSNSVVDTPGGSIGLIELAMI
jgi:hypothetical protein